MKGGPHSLLLLSPAVFVPLLVLGQAPPEENPQDFGFSRTIRVEKAGWARVRLDGPAQAHGRRRADWRVFDEGGRQMRLAVLEPLAGTIPLQQLSLGDATEGQGKLLTFDLGPRPVLHRQLDVKQDTKFEAPGCRLEGSSDGRSWSSLARADLFRTGDAAGLQKTALQYEPSSRRYLRLFWPRQAGAPDFTSVTVQTARGFPGGAVMVPLETRAAVSTGGTPAYSLTLPGAALPLLSINLKIEATSLFGYSLEGLQSQRWTPFRSGAGEVSEGSSELRIGFPGRPSGESLLRLRLHPSPGSPVRLQKATALLAPLWILFEAPRAGSYTLTYGYRGRHGTAAPLLALESVEEPVMDFVPGEEKAATRPPLPAEVTRPAAPSREPWSSASYKVMAEGVEPGTVVRLELPEPVTTEVFENRSTIRLRAGDRDVPFVRWIPPEPALALEEIGVDPTPDNEEDRTSRIALDLPPSWMLLNRLELTSPTRVLQRKVRVWLEQTPRPGVETSERFLGSGDWSCPEDRNSSLLPCEFRMDLQPSRGDWERLVLTVHDGDQEPLGDLRLAMWRRRENVLFVWPPGGEVKLLVVSGENYAGGSKRLRSHSARLLEGPLKEVRLDVEGAEAQEETSDLWRRGWLTAALALMAVVLLVVLARSLRAPPPKKE